jgi:hypothetical protein|tara:strand:- start:272 stop:556 length:285 start_codon:yes stop_codon:yes gene_type:complete
MDFFKKAIFIFILIILGIIITAKSIEPIIEKQLSQVFADRKMSKKINKELMNLTEDFTPEKREFYKKILVSLYTKWLPLIDESKKEAEIIINNK